MCLTGFLVLAMMSAHGQPMPANGDFEQGDPAHPGKPAHWDLPDGLGVQWTEAPGVPGAPPHGKAIRMDTSQTETAMVTSFTKAGLTQWVFPHPKENPIAESYGLSFYSEAMPVVAGKTYRVTFDYLAQKGTGGKLWFRAYDGTGKRVYEGTVECGQGAQKGWKQFTGVFHPTKYRPDVKTFKIMLFAFYPPGTTWFDNVRVEAVDDPVPPP